MKIRCKMKLCDITSHAWGPGKTFVFRPEYDSSIPEDQRFMAATPSGELKIFVTNPAVMDSYKLGALYYFDSEPVSLPAVDAPQTPTAA
jgi:hypothetical protein